jgi:hypothetical protein
MTMTFSRYLAISADLTDVELLAICNIALTSALGCPTYLARILRDLRHFVIQADAHPTAFAQNPLNQQWVNDEVSEIAESLAAVLVEYLQREGLVDDDNRLDLIQLAERTQQTTFGQH